MRKKCEHGKQKYYCVECKGAGICAHNKQKYTCVECKGAGICAHNKRKYDCKDCGGTGICEHKITKNMCRKCGNGSLCVHKKYKYECKECGGSSLCEHNRVKHRCRECKGAGICEHDKIRGMCKECGGSSICEHNRQKYVCKECKGAGICPHNKIRRYCVNCNSKIACKNCKTVFIKNSRFKPYCFRCYCVLNPNEHIPRRYMLKEHHVRDYLKLALPETEMIFNKTVDGGCSAYRPDIRIECFTHTIIVECDENQHKSYDSTCDLARVNNLFTDLGDRPVVIIRFNPDSYVNRDEEKIPSPFGYTKTGQVSLNKVEFEKRMALLTSVIQFWKRRIPKKLYTVRFLFYDNFYIPK